MMKWPVNWEHGRHNAIWISAVKQFLGVLICHCALTLAGDVSGGPKLEHRKKLWPLDAGDWTGVGLVAIIQVTTAGGGIGAGAILVPMYIWVMGFPQKLAIPMANVTVFGGALAQAMLQMIERHPKANRPLIDFDLALAMEPLTTAGAIIGSIAQKISPDFVISWLFVAIVGIVSARTMSKGLTMLEEQDAEEADLMKSKKEESASLIHDEEGKDEEGVHQESNPTSLRADQDDLTKYASVPGAAAQNVDPWNPQGPKFTPEVEEIMSEEATTPWWKIMINFAVLSGVFIFGITRAEFSTCGSLLYWVLIGGNILFIFAFAVGIHFFLVYQYNRKVNADYPFLAEDLRYDGARSGFIAALCLVAGVFAGTFGVGGGLLKGPLMLEYGVLPQVATATASFMLLFTTATSAAAYAFFGMIPWDYAGLFTAEGFVFGLLGQYISNMMLKRHGKSAVLIIIMASIGGVSVILMTIKAILLSVALGEGEDEAHLSIC